MIKFKKGDKIRIKDEVSRDTHRSMSPYFYEEMDSLKDKVLTFSDISPLGNIVIEEARWVLHPDWVEPVKEFKKGDKIRIKDEVSSETHFRMPPHFTELMDRWKDKVLTIRDIADLGTIEIEENGFNLHPEWVEPVKEFKKGDKIRIKDEVSSETHCEQFPHFLGEMDKMKYKVLTISSFTDRGYIKVEEFGYNLHPEWLEPAEGVSFEEFMDLIFGDTSTPEVASILEEAQEILGGARESDYGDPVANFNRISTIASSILNDTISPEQCVVVMMAVKLSREQYKHKRDNLVDLVAYTEIYNRIKEQNN